MGKKSEKNKKKKSEKVIKPPVAPEEITEMHKKFYLLQIFELENKIVKYGKALEENELHNEALETTLQEMLEEERSIVNLLTEKLEANNDKLTAINEEINMMNKKIENENEKFNKEFDSLTVDYEETHKQLIGKFNELSNRLEKIKQFQLESEDLHEKVFERENDLLLLEAKHVNEKCMLEKKLITDINGLKTEMISKIEAAGVLYIKETDLQMSTTIKKTFQENVSLTNKLEEMESRTSKIMAENMELKVKKIELQELVKSLEMKDKSLCKKLVCNKKILEMLVVKRNEEEGMNISLAEMEESLALITKERKDLEKELHDLHDYLRSILYTNGKISEYDEYLRADIGAKQALRERLRNCLYKAAKALEDIIKPKSSVVCADDLNLVSIDRTLLMENMLLLINAAKDMQHVTKKELLEMQSTPSSEQTLPHYEVGNLGFVVAENTLENEGRISRKKYTKDRDPNKLILPRKVRGPRDIAIESVTSKQYHKIVDQLVSQVPLPGLKLYSEDYHGLNDEHFDPPIKEVKKKEYFPSMGHY